MDETNFLVDLGRALRDSGYRFVTVTPETHRRVNARPENAEARAVRDVFGWSRPFRRDVLPPRLFALLEASGALGRRGDLFTSAVRFSTLGANLFAHSAFPTTEADSVFFGPDTYRFCAFAARALGKARLGRVVDIGCGSGAGGIALASRADRVVLADVNRAALRLARVNATLAGVGADVAESDVLAGVTGAFDVVLANPPYMADPLGRAYRDGGGVAGEALALRILDEALARTAPGGRILLYTGAPIASGRDLFGDEAQRRVEAAGATATYEEIDPDVFGEELDAAPYREVERIAAVGLAVTMPR